MSQAVSKALHNLGMDHVDGASTPSSPSFYYPSKDTAPTDPKPFQAVVGSLTYIARVRHDILKETSHLQSLASAPTKGDLQKAIRVLRYLKAFPSFPAVYYTTGGVQLCAHVDASFANRPDGASTSCLYLSIGPHSAPFLSKSYAQREDIAVCPASAEYFCLSMTTCKLIRRFRNLLAAIDFPQAGPSPIYSDNQPAIDLSKARTIPRKSRYMSSAAHFIRGEVANGIVTLLKRDTNVHGADLGTKEHDPKIHHWLTKITLNHDAIPTTPASAPVPVI
jgi:hypothetical protein